MINGIVENVELYNTLFKELKRINRRLITNICYGQSELKELFETRQVTYEYEETAYLMLYVREHDFLRVFFLVANTNADIETNKTNQVMVYDIFENEEKINRGQDNRIYLEGFNEYKKYHRWICKDAIVENMSLEEQFVAREELTQEALEILTHIFDKYCDYIPDEQNMKKYFESHQGILIYERASNKLLAGLLYKVEGSVITEDFIFVDEAIKGKGVGRWMQNFLFCIFREQKNMKYIAWINDENTASKNLHLKSGYKLDTISKITYKK